MVKMFIEIHSNANFSEMQIHYELKRQVCHFWLKKKNFVKSIVLDFILCVHIPLNFVHWNYESQTYLLLTHVTIIQLFLFYNKTESL